MLKTWYLLQTHTGFVVAASVSLNSYEPCLVDYMDCFPDVLSPSSSYYHFSPSTVGYPGYYHYVGLCVSVYAPINCWRKPF